MCTVAIGETVYGPYRDPNAVAVKASYLYPNGFILCSDEAGGPVSQDSVRGPCANNTMTMWPVTSAPSKVNGTEAGQNKTT